MIIQTIPTFGGIETNCYAYIDENTKHGFLIDPAAEADKILTLIKDNHWIIEKMLITHGHFDHIGAVEELHQELNIPYYIHTEGKIYLTNPAWNLSSYFGEALTLHNAHYFKEGAVFTLENSLESQLKIIYTPGHTTDSVVFYNENNHFAFVGDTIFKASIGRTDFPGGNLKQLKHSIEEKIFSLPNDTTLYSGHSEPTTISAEKTNFQYFF